jgi:aldehyde oxidoreductase
MNRPRADFIADTVDFSVNGRDARSASAKSARLAYVLRDELGLTGTKIGCDAGDCGACTVLLDGRQVCACLTPLAQAEGREVTTVEGLAAKGKLSALQAAFHRLGAAVWGLHTRHARRRDRSSLEEPQPFA